MQGDPVYQLVCVPSSGGLNTFSGSGLSQPHYAVQASSVAKGGSHVRSVLPKPISFASRFTLVSPEAHTRISAGFHRITGGSICGRLQLGSADLHQFVADFGPRPSTGADRSHRGLGHERSIGRGSHLVAFWHGLRRRELRDTDEPNDNFCNLQCSGLTSLQPFCNRHGNLSGTSIAVFLHGHRFGGHSRHNPK